MHSNENTEKYSVWQNKIFVINYFSQITISNINKPTETEHNIMLESYESFLYSFQLTASLLSLTDDKIYQCRHSFYELTTSKVKKICKILKASCEYF